MNLSRFWAAALVFALSLTADAAQFTVIRNGQLFEIYFDQNAAVSIRAVEQEVRTYLIDATMREPCFAARNLGMFEDPEGTRPVIRFTGSFLQTSSEADMDRFAEAIKTRLEHKFPDDKEKGDAPKGWFAGGAGLAQQAVVQMGSGAMLFPVREMPSVVVMNGMALDGGEEQIPTALSDMVEERTSDELQRTHSDDLKRSRLYLFGQLLWGSARYMIGGAFCPQGGMSPCSHCIPRVNVEHCPSCHVLIENAPGGPRMHCTNCERDYLSGQQCNLPCYCCEAGCYLPLPNLLTCGINVAIMKYKCATCLPGCWIKKR